MSATSDKARTFVKSVDLSGVPRAIVAMDAATEAGEIFETAKKQAQVVGSTLFSFAEGVTDDVREAISDSALLAQLVANKRFSAGGALVGWYAEYTNVLENLGWVVQSAGWNDYSAEGNSAEVHKQIIDVLTVALGPSVGALALITSAVDTLQKMNPDSSWLTIFSRESQKATIARFQVGLVEKGPEAEVLVTMLACLIEAKKAITQVLFFKFREEKAAFKANSTTVTVNRAALADIGPAVRAKVRAFQADYVSSIQNL